MSAVSAPPLQRLAATAAAPALLGSAGCALPYHSRCGSIHACPETGDVKAEGGLAGDLHLYLAALMDQRLLHWNAADEAEQVKAATTRLHRPGRWGDLRRCALHRQQRPDAARWAYRRHGAGRRQLAAT